MSAQPEVWRVSTIEGVFETDLETLKQWISEGCVLPTDKVSKGTHLIERLPEPSRGRSSFYLSHVCKNVV